jgi:hypothetical protein
MQMTVKILNWVVRLDGLVLVILGIMFWMGHGLSAVPLHMALGALLVVGLWLLAIVGALLHVPITRVVVALVWGALVLWIGLTQQTLVPGTTHWVVQVAHLLLGLGAIGVAQGIASAVPTARHAA